MEEPLKHFLERTTPFGTLARTHGQKRLEKKFRRWEKEGATGAMPNLGKQQVVIEYIKKFSPEVFVETGTYKGKMVYAVMPYIDHTYSIELDETYCQDAQKRSGGYPNIHVIQGQNGGVLPSVLEGIDEPYLFRLGAHYSGGSTPRRIWRPVSCRRSNASSVIRAGQNASCLLTILAASFPARPKWT